MTSPSSWHLITCPSCQSKDISFREARSVSVYFKQSPDGAPPGDATRVIYEDFTGSLYEYDTRTGYLENMRAECHSCGLKWVIPDCKRLEDLISRPASAPQPRPKKTKRKVKAGKVVQDLVDGMSDPELMDKYNLSERQLERLLQQLVGKGLITQRQIDERLNMDDTQVTRAFDDTRRSIEELENDFEPAPPPEEPAAAAPTPSSRKADRPRKAKLNLNDFIADVLTGMSDAELMAKHSLKPKQLEYVFQKTLDLGYLTAAELYQRTNAVDTAVTKDFVNLYQSLKEWQE